MSKKSKQKESNPVGRPKKAICVAEVEKLCALMCTDEELAAYFGCCVRTIERARKDPKIAQAMEHGYAKGRMSVRRGQMAQAMAGNTTMLIWLGKILLNQRETINQEHSGEIKSRLYPLPDTELDKI